MTEIPIQNLYYLLCYAWDRLDQGSLVDVKAGPTTELVDLFSVVLTRGVGHLARRGFSQGYVRHDEELRGVRGRVNLTVTARRFLLQHGQSACSFDELNMDTMPNRIIKATLALLARDPLLHRDNRTVTLSLTRKMNSVADIRLTGQCFRVVQLNGSQRFYAFLLKVCRVVLDSALVGEGQGITRFRDFIRDERRMALLFQHFVRNFLCRERPDLDVRSEVINWDVQNISGDQSCAYIPQMITDVSVRKGGSTLVIDTKYYQEALRTNRGTERIREENLYQLFAYLSNISDRPIEGMLLYPTVKQSLDLHYRFAGIPIRIRTLNLAQPWTSIHRELSELVQ